MLKMVAGNSSKQFLAVGLSFNNLDKFKAEVGDTFIRINREETGLPVDVILYSGNADRALGTENNSGRQVFLVGIDLEQIDRLRREPGKCLIKLDNETYNVGFDTIIFYGETEAAMTEQCQELISPGTKMSVDERLKQ